MSFSMAMIETSTAAGMLACRMPTLRSSAGRPNPSASANASSGPEIRRTPAAANISRLKRGMPALANCTPSAMSIAGIIAAASSSIGRAMTAGTWTPVTLTTRAGISASSAGVLATRPKAWTSRPRPALASITHRTSANTKLARK
jgi:hypothetical protein